MVSKHLNIKSPAIEKLEEIADKFYTGELSRAVHAAILVLDDFICTVGNAPYIKKDGSLTYPNKKK